MSRSPSSAVGIDFGTTKSVVASVDERAAARTIRNDEGGLTTPSVVFFDDSGPIVGSAALEAGRDEPERLASLLKRDIGQRRYRSAICGQRLPPEVLQAIVFGRLRRDAESELGEVDGAAFAVPSFFNEPCRKATQDAARLAGLNVVGLINEPMAAALCYAVQHHFTATPGSDRSNERVLVYDLGAGKLDVALIELENRSLRTLASDGDRDLGGIHWDRIIANHLAELWMAEHGDDPLQSTVSEQDLMRKAQQAKHTLSQRESVVVPFSFDGQRIRPELARRQLEAMSEGLVRQSIAVADSVLDAAKVSWNDLSRVLLVGGSTRMPMIAGALSRRSSVTLDRSLSAEEAVAHGASIYAAIQLGSGGKDLEGISIHDVNAHDLGVLARDPQEGNPRRQIMIAKNTSLPASHCVRFRTHQDDQQNIKIEVVEGGDDRGGNATAIGKYLVEDLPEDLPQGTAVDIRFDYSQDSRLAVTARLPDIKRNAKMSLHRASGMTEKRLRHWKTQIDRGIVVEAKSDRVGANQPSKEPAIETPQSKTTWQPTPNIESAPKSAPPEKPSRKSSGSSPEKDPKVAAPIAAVGESKPVIKLVRKPPPAKRGQRSGGWRSRRQPFGPQEKN